MPSLIEIASRVGYPFESSPSGRWVKFMAGDSPVYVVEGAWGNGYLVWVGSDAPTGAVEHYLRPEEAIKAVLKLAS